MPGAAKPLPTPFDITTIPRFPFEPEPAHWLLIVLLGLLFILVRIGAKSANKLKHISLNEDPAETVLSELDRLLALPADKHIAGYATLVVKRWLSHLDREHDYTSKTSFQIKQIDTSQRPKGWQKIIACLLEIDAVRFAGKRETDFDHPLKQLRMLTEQLAQELKTMEPYE